MDEPETATLTFKLDTPSNRRWSGALPIEVRNDKLVLTARGISDDKLSVPPGRYFVTALLPNGDQAIADDPVEVKAGDIRNVEIPLSDLPFPPVLESTSSFLESFWEISRPLTQYFFKQSVAIVRGNWLPAAMPGIAPLHPLRREPTTRSNMDFEFDRDGVWVEIESSGKYNYFAVPVDEGGKTTVEWSLDVKSDKLQLRFDFHDGELNSLLDFIINERALEARSISGTLVTRPEYYATKRQSHLRALLGAYVLIRANQLTDLDRWTDNLVRSSPWLPDALAVRIEYLARNGKYDAAIRHLLKIPEVGTPLFRSGITYLAERARSWTKLAVLEKSGLSLGDSDRQKLDQIARVFGDLLLSLDLNLSISTLRHVPQIKSG
jgi:hypothetical protein